MSLYSGRYFNPGIGQSPQGAVVLNEGSLQHRSLLMLFPIFGGPNYGHLELIGNNFPHTTNRISVVVPEITGFGVDEIDGSLDDLVWSGIPAYEDPD